MTDRVSVLKDQRGHVSHELELAGKYPGIHPYRDPAHVQGLRDELAAVDAELAVLYRDIEAGQLARAGIRQATPAEGEAIARAHKALEDAADVAEGSIRAHAVRVREAARALYEAESAAGARSRYDIIWGQARNRLMGATRQAFEN